MRTMCLRVDQDILIDAGTGSGDLSMEQTMIAERFPGDEWPDCKRCVHPRRRSASRTFLMASTCR
jgi:hypothetical protein